MFLNYKEAKEKKEGKKMKTPTMKITFINDPTDEILIMTITIKR